MNREDLKKKIKEIGKKIQEVEDAFRKDKNLSDPAKALKMKEFRIRFPGGVIRTVETVKKDIPFFEEINDNEVIAANVAYLWQWIDVLEWLLFRFNLDFSAASMACKTGLVTYAHIAAAISTEFIRWYRKNVDPKVNLPKGFKAAIRFLNEHVFHKLQKSGFNVKGLKKDLENLWELRNNIHIEDTKRVSKKEYREYTREELIKARKKVERLLAALNHFYYHYQ